MTTHRQRPEVLAPVGGPECLPAAVAGGADAVYLGLRHFNARGRATNFRRDDLPRHVAYLHHHGLKCYLVMNTLLHDDEHAKALDMATAAATAGVDAVIVQDLGLWRLLGQEVPDLPRHASTQMTIHCPEQIQVLAGLGAERVILARELSIDELRRCCAAAATAGVEVEHFVHGALCYAFSGQCLMSNFAGCRSANRGTCAQNCRFQYRGLEGGLDTEISMRDLALADRVSELADAGVVSLKIEGRLKGPDYVYTVSRVYRAAAEAWAEGKAFDATIWSDHLETVFARPFTATPLDGIYDQRARTSVAHPEDRRRDAELVTMDRRTAYAVLRSRRAPKAGEGYRWVVDRFTGGFLIIGVQPDGRADHWQCRIRVDARGPRVPPGTPLERNRDAQRYREADSAMAAVPLARAPKPATPVQGHLTCRVGEPPRLELSTADGRCAVACGDESVVMASNCPLDRDTAELALAAMGGSGFCLAGLELAIDTHAFCPSSVLKTLRRSAVEVLRAQAPSPGATRVAWSPPAAGEPRSRCTGLWVAVADLPTAEVALGAGADRVWLDSPTLDCWGREAPALAIPSALHGRLWLRHPAVTATSPHLAVLGLPVVAGHLGVVHAARAAGLPVIADFTCNVWSHASLAAMGDLGCEASVISLECSAREVARLVTRCSAPSLPGIGLVVHGRVPAMLTRQDHGLQPGEGRMITASEREGGLPYEIERRAGGWTAIWEARRIAAPEAAAATRGLVDGWIIDCGGCDTAATAAVVAAYRRQLDDGIIVDLDALGPSARGAGWFPGHLEIGSRALDDVQGALAEAGAV